MDDDDDRLYVDKKLRVHISVALKTASPGLFSTLKSGPTFAKEAAHRELVDRIATSLLRSFEIGQLDANSGLYVTNYCPPLNIEEGRATSWKRRA
ncbi:hypothetical protein LZK98_08345 [Sphingomonas cannabina]|uniref:hypothetical protein n=1 Tax=Sphingomonas cannabina TaxID=2899123 RepID=UPI001F2459FE|nr:hypothetical protein [Sphingomonas cannabina]UIJ46939.1 hypothetical protein LZK98_08345 [Sphingomonas cannabina]